eukprot:84502_1
MVTHKHLHAVYSYIYRIQWKIMIMDAFYLTKPLFDIIINLLCFKFELLLFKHLIITSINLMYHIAMPLSLINCFNHFKKAQQSIEQYNSIINKTLYGSAKH